MSDNLRSQDSIYFFDASGAIITSSSGISRLLLSAEKIPTISYRINWLIMVAAFDLLGYDLDIISSASPEIDLPEHRLEYVCTVSDIAFYNDSKSTMMVAAQAAVAKLKQHEPDIPIILILGGVSEGLDRTEYIPWFAPYVKEIICYGQEADLLSAAAQRAHIPAYSYPNLEVAFDFLKKYKDKKINLLFSPGGASFDLYNNYVERGNAFKKLAYAFK